MKKSVILLHSTTVPYQLSYLGGQAGYMQSKGFDVQAVSSPENLLDEFGIQEHVRVHGVEMSRTIAPVNDLRSVWQFVRKLKEIRPTIVHSHTPKGGLIGMISASIARVPIRVYHIHGLPMMTAVGYKRLLLRWSEKTTCRLASQVLCVSESIRKVAVAEGLCPKGKIKVLHKGSINGVDSDGKFNPDRFSPDQRLSTRKKYGIPGDAVVAGFIGRVAREKGLVEIAMAWATLREEFQQLRLLIVGPFEPQDPLPAEIEESLRNDPRVHLIGLEWDTPPLYSIMDIFLLPSYREGFPIVPLEAASMRLPVIASAVPGCVDAVKDGVTGVLVPPRNVKSLTEAMRRYITDPAMRHNHGEAGRTFIHRDFRQEDVWEATYNEYAHLLEEHGFAARRREC